MGASAGASAHLSFQREADTACLVYGIALQCVLQQVVLLRTRLKGAPTWQHVVKHVLQHAAQAQETQGQSGQEGRRDVDRYCTTVRTGCDTAAGAAAASTGRALL